MEEKKSKVKNIKGTTNSGTQIIKETKLCHYSFLVITKLVVPLLKYAHYYNYNKYKIVYQLLTLSE